ncbi:MAG: delta-aminolevulinic acid dehydratase [Rhodospirillales bacterium 69-11]|nr:MAG: delta-aminolevulinic acid dehydratase [Rhodospirillales bacterium 69-11]
MVPPFPTTRLRRLRASQALRDLVQETTVSLNDLIYPIFVEEELDDFAPVESMPGIYRIPERKLAGVVKEIAAAGIKSVMTFGVSHHKDDHGGDTLREDGLLARMLKRAKDAAPELVVISDTCFCEYTTHGHCGVIHDDDVHNDETIENLGRQSVIAARAGADIIAPSAMMDGQIAAIRAALDGNGLSNTPVMAYSSKFASAFYGPFRAASGCDLKGDRKAYQMNPLNGREAIRESIADEAEGADMLMVKPAGPYLDVISQIRQRSLLPLAAYQVSGEYAMIKFAAQAGAIDEARVVRESLGAIKRAGADLILTYFAMDIARQGF